MRVTGLWKLVMEELYKIHKKFTFNLQKPTKTNFFSINFYVC